MAEKACDRIEEFLRDMAARYIPGRRQGDDIFELYTSDNGCTYRLRISAGGCELNAPDDRPWAARVETTSDAFMQIMEGKLNVVSALMRRRRNRGMVGAAIRVMVVGIPNVGKSTFINSFAGTTRAKAANKPGVTRGKQWISVDNFDLMDMPGVLWKKFDSLETASNLAFIGSIRDDILDIEELACGLLSSVRQIYPQQLLIRYKLDESALDLEPYALLQAIGAKRGMLISGGEVDTERAAKMLVGEFRASKWGRLSLERPPRREAAEKEADDAEDIEIDEQ